MKTLILFSFFFIPLSLISQEELYQTTRDEFNYGEFRPNNTAPIYGIAEKPGKLMGNIYLDSIFRSSAVVFFKEIVKRYDPSASDSIAGYKLRINLLEKLVEFKMNVKVVSLSVLKKKEPTYHVALSIGDKNAYYYLKTTYYAKIENGNWKEIQNNKNAWLDLTGSRAKWMSSYLQQNQLNLKLTSDLRQFFQYFDKIMVE